MKNLQISSKPLGKNSRNIFNPFEYKLERNNFSISELEILNLLNFCKKYKEHITLENIVIAYTNVVKDFYTLNSIRYNIYKEFKKDSKIFRKYIKQSILIWWKRNLGSILIKKKGQIL